VALQQSYFKALFQQHPALRSVIHNKVQEFRQSFNFGSSRNAVELVTATMNAWDLDSLKTFDERKCKAKPAFRMIRKYMRMIELLLQFLRAIRTGNWRLKVTVEQLIKYLFALDLTNYSRMMVWYIAEIYTLKEIDPVL